MLKLENIARALIKRNDKHWKDGDRKILGKGYCDTDNCPFIDWSVRPKRCTLFDAKLKEDRGTAYENTYHDQVIEHKHALLGYLPCEECNKLFKGEKK